MLGQLEAGGWWWQVLELLPAACLPGWIAGDIVAEVKTN